MSPITSFGLGWVGATTFLLVMNILFGTVEGLEDLPAWQKEEEPKPELKCLKFSDGRLAVIEMYGCTGGYETISWFLSKGYSIVASYDEDGYTDEVFMSR